jgi:alanyl-tRNA synthetase
MTAQEIRSAYLKFFADRGHTIIPRANLVPKEDATTLFTGSGMQPLVPYLLGQPHPAGTRLADSQTCFRAEDIDEVGDNRHTTFFEMLGNWSLGDYFKAEQLPWFWEFLTDVVKLDPERLYVTAFIGDPKNHIPQDTEAADIWTKLFKAKSIDAKVIEIGSEADGYKKGMQGGRIFFYDAKKNWWSRAGVPENMPAGEPGGPDSEVFYEFTHIEHDLKWGEHCHPNCDCGRFLEIGNSVFMQYLKQEDGSFKPLPKQNVDFGGGLERIAAAQLNSDDMFRISLLWPIVEHLEKLSHKKHEDNLEAMRVIADHLRTVTFLAVDGVVPSNTAQGYVMRRFFRRALVKAHDLGLKDNFVDKIIPTIADLYRDAFPEVDEHEQEVVKVLVAEEQQFRRTLASGMHQLQRLTKAQLSLTGIDIFRLYDTYGFPVELIHEEAKKQGIEIHKNWESEYNARMNMQKDRSRTATAGQFKGGLADHSEMSTKYHTATHLMYKALRIVLGDHVIQRGSNITPERLRFDFSHPEKMIPEQIKRVEDIVNEQIAKDWPMGFREEKTADVLGKVLGAFGDRYGDMVKIYTVGDPDGDNYSREICGGPHVTHTGVLAEGGKKFKIKKEESSSAGVRRIKAVLE